MTGPVMSEPRDVLILRSGASADNPDMGVITFCAGGEKEVLRIEPGDPPRLVLADGVTADEAARTFVEVVNQIWGVGREC